MRPITPAAFVVALAAMAVLVAGSPAGFAQSGEGWPSRWAHAYVSSTAGGDVYISYMEAAGCRSTKVEVDPVRAIQGPDLNDMAATMALATAKAVSQMGNSGWQMVGEGTSYCHSHERKAIHFKLAR